jgi:hypothetical protein
LAILAAILRASSLLSSLAADRLAGLILEIDVGELLPGAVDYDEGGADVLDRPGRRESAIATFSLRGESDRSALSAVSPYSYS